MALVILALLVSANSQEFTPQDCTRLPELSERSKAMASEFGQRQPGRGIRLQMLARALRLLREERNATAVSCPTTTSPRRFCDNGCDQREPSLLWTFPGSGNTFARMLVEASTSIYTGSVFNDPGLSPLMPGEKEKIETLTQCRRLSVIKAHPNIPILQNRDCGFPLFKICSRQLTKVVIVTRHPFSAAWAEFQRRFVFFHKHSSGNEHKVALTETSKAEWLSSWSTEGPMLVGLWRDMWKTDGEYTSWMAAYGDDSYFITRFEDLINPEAREIELRHTIAFIGLTSLTSDASIACAFTSHLAGSFHRSGRRRQRLLQASGADIVEPIDPESASAHEAWLALAAPVREGAWGLVRLYAAALGYSINTTDYKLHWHCPLEDI